jgi:hypothetical protein
MALTQPQGPLSWPSHEYQITPDNLQRRHHGRENPRAREAAKKAVREADRAEAEPCQSELRVTAGRRNYPQRSRNASMAAKVRPADAGSEEADRDSGSVDIVLLWIFIPAFKL